MKILVLGGTGAMGVDLVKIFAERGEDVTVTSRTERNSEFYNVKYVKGNAHDMMFLQILLKDHYDAIVDFMSYDTAEFEARRDLLLDAADQYVFLSSSRVYADADGLITEDSPRLLDASADNEYLRTDEYALAKAREENLLHESGRKNWTIIRPYITYSSQRLQLGVYEKELWLYRVLHEKTIIFSNAIAEKYTTMTMGKDVAGGIAKLIGNERAMGEAFHITTDKTVKWDDVFAVYNRVFKDVTGREIKIKYADDLEVLYESMENKYQVIYDRLYNRRFDNKKFLQTVGEYNFTEPEIGLENCFRDFLKNPKFRNASYASSPQVQMDRIVQERTRLSEISGAGQKGKYLLKRYLPIEAIRFIRNIRN